MITNGIFDWAIPLWLPDGKRYGTCTNERATMHSLEARYRGKYGLSQNIRDMATSFGDLSRNDRSVVIASLRDLYWAWDEPTREWTAWHTTTFEEGFVVQHAPLHWMIAHGHDCNDEASGHEAEGRAPTPLTPAQVEAYVHMLSDLSGWKGYPFKRERLIEHRRCPRANTACPGGRYAPLYRRLGEIPQLPLPEQEDEDEMTPKEREALWGLTRIVAGWGLVDSEEIQNPDTMAERIKDLDDRNINVLLALRRQNSALLRIQEALEDLSASGDLSAGDREQLAHHMRAMATLVEEGDAADALADPEEEQ